ncbi:hypothetical protein PLESTB_000622300 [Pleodorina starrii]|uniref:Uncharacterized protein n=1 Tax=Pleodorina starrii TaxID=330485 RepID=A0A9W6BIH5_9CHLO|nr:hypothetical protein PLESTM_001730400 [Pleodorina starrii]GLC52375.1 hypothetical protein PLESTB_000622300 [Pleodorina starrii]GLC67957.1 hypothetical protein PLESTF_000628000 [Pleodorina starrii]
MKAAVASIPWRRLTRAAASCSAPFRRPMGHHYSGSSGSTPSVATWCRRPKSSSHTGDHEYQGPHHPTHRFGPLAEPLALPHPHPHAHPHPSRRDTGPRPVPPEPLPPPPRDLSPEMVSYTKPASRGVGGGGAAAASGGFGGGGGSGVAGSRGRGVMVAGFNSATRGGGGRAHTTAATGRGASSGYSGRGGPEDQEQGQRQHWELAAGGVEEDPESPQVLAGRAMPPGARISSGPLHQQHPHQHPQQEAEARSGEEEAHGQRGGGGGGDGDRGGSEGSEVVPPLAS